MQTKQGFTLLESLITISIVSLLLLLALPLQRHESFERIELKKLQHYLEQAHKKSIQTQTKVELQFIGNSVYIDDSEVRLMHCDTGDQSFSFLKNGNVNKSITIPMYCKNKNYELVVHLGSGHIVIR